MKIICKAIFSVAWFGSLFCVELKGPGPRTKHPFAHKLHRQQVKTYFQTYSRGPAIVSKPLSIMPSVVKPIQKDLEQITSGEQLMRQQLAVLSQEKDRKFLELTTSLLGASTSQPVAEELVEIRQVAISSARLLLLIGLADGLARFRNERIPSPRLTGLATLSSGLTDMSALWCSRSNAQNEKPQLVIPPRQVPREPFNKHIRNQHVVKQPQSNMQRCLPRAYSVCKIKNK